jgi:hypothetical protein
MMILLLMNEDSICRREMKSMENARQVANNSYFGLTLRDRAPAIFSDSVLPFSANFSSFIVQRQLRRSVEAP